MVEMKAAWVNDMFLNIPGGEGYMERNTHREAGGALTLRAHVLQVPLGLLDRGQGIPSYEASAFGHPELWNPHARAHGLLSAPRLGRAPSALGRCTFPRMSQQRLKSLYCPPSLVQSASLGLSPPSSQPGFQNYFGPQEQLPLPSTGNDACISCLPSAGHPASTIIGTQCTHAALSPFWPP